MKRTGGLPVYDNLAELVAFGAWPIDPERIGDCSFMVLTADGPVSMCQVNAGRGAFVLKPVKLPGTD